MAVRLGATGLESDVWVTADGVAVLDHDGVFGRLRRRRIRDLRRDELPDHVPTLDEFYAEVGSDLPLSLDVKDVDSFAATVEVARRHAASERLWLCHHDWTVVAGWKDLAPEANLVDSTHFDRFEKGPERRAMSLTDAGIGTINMHHSLWSAGLVTMFHRFGVECFAWDLQQSRHLDAVLAMGVDGVYSDHVDRMNDALTRRPHRR